MDADGIAFIFIADAFFISRTEAAARILLEINGPRQRCPVDMGIEDGQENDDFPALLVEIGIFFHFFDADDSPISRRHQEMVVCRHGPTGVAEEIGEIRNQQQQRNHGVGVDEIACCHSQ